MRIDSAVRVEILKYRLVPHQSKRKFDTLAWWRKHRFEYPYLAAIARLMLAVPATSAPFQRIFSVCGLIVTRQRAGMDELAVGVLVFLRNVFAFEKRYGMVL